MEGRSTPLNIVDTQSFQAALSFYEKKEYTKALKEVDGIIKRRRDHTHGESLCLKGLILFHLNNRENAQEAEKLLNEGSKIDSKSPVAWHMCGIFYKLRKDFKKAYESYLQSYLLKQDNPNVKQDMAMLAAQMRDYKLLVDVRKNELAQKMSSPMGWTSLVVALFLKQDFSGVEKTIKLYQEIMKVEQQSKTLELSQEIELSELLMLKNRAIMAQPGHEQRALDELTLDAPLILDKLALEESKAALLFITDKSASYDAYLKLLKRNPNNFEYLKKLEQLCNVEQLFEDLEIELQSDLITVRALELNIKFKERAGNYISKLIDRKVPSAFMMVKDFYADPKKRDILEEIVPKIVLKFADSSVYAAIFYAQHLSYTSHQTEAVEYIKKDFGELDTDVKIDLELVVARLEQRAGAYISASQRLLKTSKLNSGDRYLNTLTTEAFFLSNDANQGYQEAFKFPRWGKHAETDEECMKHLIQMESVNVLISASECHSRRHEYGLALKRAYQVIQIFHSYFMDQYDFHYYGPKRGTLREYVDMVHWEDNIYSSNVYQRALSVAAHVLLINKFKIPDGVSELSEQNRKKQRAKLLDTLDLKHDDDPFGIKMLESSDTLITLFEDYKLSEPGNNPRTLLTGFKILLAQKKYVLAAQMLKRISSNSNNDEFNAWVLITRHFIEQDKELPAAVTTLALKMLPEAELSEIGSLQEYVKVKVFLGDIEGLEDVCAKRLTELETVEDVRSVGNNLRRVGFNNFEFRIAQIWPLYEQNGKQTKQK